MKNRAIVSERGTITIPEHIRKIAKIHPGDLMEFKPEKDKIILAHLIVKYSHKNETFMDKSEWDKFDKLMQKQLNKGQYRSYADLDKAKQHSHRLINIQK